MKRLLPMVCVALLVAVAPVQASPNYALLGAALGAGAGFIAANNIDGVSPYVAVPVLAVVGGILGNQVNQKMKDRHNGPVQYEGGQPRPKGPVPVVTDPQPGVDLIKVSILNANGVRTDVPILRVKDRYVGPQGEEYPALPTTEQLTKRYGM
jgi:hypothetical protein